MRRFTLAVFVALATAARESRGDGPALSPAAAEDCGTAALFYLVNVLGRPATLPEVAAALPPRHPRGFSLKELREAAGRLGVRLEGVRLDATGDRAPDRPMLAFLRRGDHGHFVVARPVGHTGRLVQVLDGPLEPDVVDAALVARQEGWTGIALVPARPDRRGPVAAVLAAGAVAAALAWRARSRRRVGHASIA